MRSFIVLAFPDSLSLCLDCNFLHNYNCCNCLVCMCSLCQTTLTHELCLFVHSFVVCHWICKHSSSDYMCDFSVASLAYQVCFYWWVFCRSELSIFSCSWLIYRNLSISLFYLALLFLNNLLRFQFEFYIILHRFNVQCIHVSILEWDCSLDRVGYWDFIVNKW